MELDPLEWIQVELLQRGVLEQPLVDAMSRVLRPGDTFVDVGSHIGFYSLVGCKLVGESGRVIAIDPQPYNATRLLRDAELNGFAHLQVHIAAVGEAEQFLTLANQSVTDKARLTLAEGPVVGGGHVNDVNQHFVVPLRRLDNLLRESGMNKVRLIKISVVGYEWAVVRGLGSLLGGIEHLVIDMRDDTTSGKPFELVQQLLRSNYALTTLNGQDWKPGEPLPANCLFATLAK